MNLNAYAQMTQEYLVQRVRERMARRRERLAALSSKAEAQAWQKQALTDLTAHFPPAPEHCPLDVQVTGEVQRHGFRIEKLHFQSRPGTRVTANLYIPTTGDGPWPGVVVPCGHSHNGKASGGYQDACARLALHGFVAIIYDPFNQGERDQYIDITEREATKYGVYAHNMMGKQLELVGEWFGAWRTWDGHRAADLLCERPDVDADRLGLTGNSGGGTLTTWLWASDERFTMAAPSCFTSSLLTNLENELPADAEQYPHGLLGDSYERTDMLIMRAPKPLLVMGQKYDFFDRRGLRAAYDELQAVYTLHDAADRLEFFADNCPHGFTPPNQQAMIRFFCKHAGIPCPSLREPPEPLPDEALRVTPEGSDIRAGATPIFQLIHRRATALAQSRPTLAPAALRTRLRELLNLPPAGPVPHYRVLRAVEMLKRPMARYAVESEPGIQAIIKHPVTDGNHSFILEPPEEICLYLPHASSQEDLERDPWAGDLIERGLYAVDVRGLGESMPELNQSEDFFFNCGKDYFYHGHALMLGESYLGRRVHDLLQVARVLRSEGAQRIHLYGRGQGALLALFAAVLDDTFTSVHLHQAPPSYESWTEAPVVLWPAANALRGVLAHFDLPDCYQLLDDKLTLTCPWDARMQPAPPPPTP